jgi:phospholipid N-methyltransferase
MAQAMSARVEGERLKRTQAALRGLARCHRAGNLPDELAAIKLTSKKAVYELLGAELEYVSNGFHGYHVDTGKPSDESIEAHLLWQFSDPKSDDDAKTDHIAQLMRDLQFANYPGYFPTPPAVVDIMLDHARIEAGHSILEPSAGSGAITDAITARHGDEPLVVVYEINPKLCEVLQAKGFDARPVDFLAASIRFRFDRVLMNPPFEKQADIDHVQAAFKTLRAGGRLVSVMSPSPFFRDNAKSKAFRDWLDNLGGEVIDLPAGSFKESGTGVQAKLVIIDKE